jgi:hypothetical protein
VKKERVKKEKWRSLSTLSSGEEVNTSDDEVCIVPTHKPKPTAADASDDEAIDLTGGGETIAVELSAELATQEINKRGMGGIRGGSWSSNRGGCAHSPAEILAADTAEATRLSLAAIAEDARTAAENLAADTAEATRLSLAEDAKLVAEAAVGEERARVRNLLGHAGASLLVA